ncbi:hypothetical protein HLB44_16855 [Aquincola sp. S2]|uniref:DNA-binding protein n=1 Tax=Pseudaquabacterium terrae TaxID=2732868 RepID=A0ABX2EJD1_9BURK|nr:hypothetical protein [Aquabacterium terrae]NRF68664.1 hypothetical protein [Aquabacterium terrae]
MTDVPKKTRRTKTPQEAAAAAGLEGLQLIGADDLAALLGRSPRTVRVDASRNPGNLPPRFHVPGTRKLAWRVVDVRRWSESTAAEARVKAAAAKALYEREQQAARTASLRVKSVKLPPPTAWPSEPDDE